MKIRAILAVVVAALHHRGVLLLRCWRTLLFGGSGAEAGMGKVSIKTSPKGAQIAINRRILVRPSLLQNNDSPHPFAVGF